ncbi:MAG TPA: YwhD family protein [Sphingobacteriaceae bacterium]|nr:YwhD family protein [Sphingobacteriaceae bacterium]
MDLGDPAFKLIPDPAAQGEDLGNLAAAIVEEDTAYFSAEALHARSPAERGVKWVDDPQQVPQGKEYWVVWITLGRNEAGGRCYRGLVACPMWIDREAMVGYKSLADHVNGMRAALAGQVEVGNMTPEARQALRRLLSWEKELWENTPAPIRRQLSADGGL